MSIEAKEVAFYKREGYVGLENVFSPEEIGELTRVTDEFIEQSRELTEHNEVFDLDFEAGHSKTNPKLRRIKSPHTQHPVYDAAFRNPKLLNILECLLGPNIRGHGTKLNMKAPGGGAQVEWHTDWAFYPHTNDDILEVGLALDDMKMENGCLMVIPGSHKEAEHPHHEDGFFVGAVSEETLNMEDAVPITLKAGGISVHHVRELHGSAPNISNRPRRLLLMGYMAADAFPLTGYGDWESWNQQMLRGEPTNEPRMESIPCRISEPRPEGKVGIFQIQSQMKKSHFQSAKQKTN